MNPLEESTALNCYLERKQKKRKRGAKSKYDDPTFLRVLEEIWILTDKMSSNLLHVAMPDWLKSYEKLNRAVESDVRDKLLSISPRTIDRGFKKIKEKHGKGRRGTKPINFCFHSCSV